MKRKKRRSKRNVHSGIAYVQATFNNTLITIADENGATLAQGSPARVGFKGSKRSTAYAATQAAKDVAERAIKQYGLKEVKVFLKGPGSGRNASVKGLDAAGLRVTYLADRTPIPHNGCRPKKPPKK